ncbi:ankyrin repeat domain-containing protein 49 [Lingula anatina]|uniref:Ankyrin repeat domain-containing protein 49 n=1 Tax=Lingula anatina TaxID=7574 RepID=A0A1S3H883_LINAN|nr:ankyrin repeat domain-containing protein 49 [Lingula anatina]|eukprot:XP_013381696.1 ankyrin repeat domain-containing protein 49 [Lingula anatina]
MAAPMSLATAAANGDVFLIKDLLQRGGADINLKSSDGMTPLSVAAFWGYSDIVQLLLEHGADVNSCNSGTMWTALHCAAFQGHGKVIMKIMEYKPNLSCKDNQGRTAADFASALDAIWPFFAAAGCKRTSKADLIKMNIVRKVSSDDASVPQSDIAHFSRPGSSYAMRSQSLRGNWNDVNKEVAAITGDVLASLPEEPLSRGYNNGDSPSLAAWRS